MRLVTTTQDFNKAIKEDFETHRESIDKTCELCEHHRQSLDSLGTEEYNLVNTILNDILMNEGKHQAIVQAFCYGINIGARAQDNALKRIEEEKELERMMK
jgi:hypothetical protein